jgi:hypothetical protein
MKLLNQGGKYHTDPSPPSELIVGRKGGDAGRMKGESSFEGAALEHEVAWLESKNLLLMLKTREGDEDTLTLLLSLSTVFSTALDKR